MVFVIFSAKDNWNNFWQKVGDFFMTPDEAGMNYLTRILLSVGLIIVAWLLLRLLSLIYKKAFQKRKIYNGVEVWN